MVRFLTIKWMKKCRMAVEQVFVVHNVCIISLERYTSMSGVMAANV